MHHPRHRNPPPSDDNGVDPFDALTARGDEELDREDEARRDDAGADDRWVRSVDYL